MFVETLEDVWLPHEIIINISRISDHFLKERESDGVRRRDERRGEVRRRGEERRGEERRGEERRGGEESLTL